VAEANESWHLDKRVPISLILVLLGQTVAIVWWASAVENRVAVLETTYLTQQSEISNTEDHLQDLNNTLTRVDTTLGFLLDEIRKDE
jgi:uncharacterized coiled-coil protein SlyX